MDPVEQKISSYIAQNILFSKNGFSYPMDASFLENGIVDSQNIMEIIIYVEEEFGTTISDEDIVPDNFDSVTKIANFIHSKKNGRST